MSQRRALESAQHADKIIAVSDHTRKLLIERAGFRPEQIFVTPLAADDGMRPQPLESVRAAMDRYSIRSPYIISAGRIEKKKGIVEIVEALAQLPSDVQLVLVGPDGFGADEVRSKVAELKLQERVKFVGWVLHHDLACLLSGATCYISACRYEGFGIAVLDALACGCPVVAYKAGAVPETVGDAAVLVDPSGPENLAAGIRPLLDSPDTYHHLAKLGVERAAQFTWQKTGEQTWQILTA
jgi:glycosyltransferase involved in cell wall biosynthesis